MIQEIIRLLKCIQIFILTGAILSGCAAPTVEHSEGATCLLMKPSENSELVSTHGVNLLIYPASIPKNFTGCQSVWLESGHLLMFSKFSTGTILTTDIFEPGEEKITCIYNNGVPSKEPSEKCLQPLHLIK